jgi:hypothetical protein
VEIGSGEWGVRGVGVVVARGVLSACLVRFASLLKVVLAVVWRCLEVSVVWLAVWLGVVRWVRRGGRLR